LTLTAKQARKVSDLLGKAVTHAEQYETDEIELVVLSGRSAAKEKQVLLFARSRPRLSKINS